jgi:hypothetical protein
MQLSLAATAAAAFTAACPPSLIPTWIKDLNTLARASRVLDDGGLARKKALAAAFGALCAAVVDLDQVSLDLKWN